MGNRDASQPAGAQTAAGRPNLTVARYTYAQAAFHLAAGADEEKIAREAIRLDREGQCPESIVLLARSSKQENSSDAVVEYKTHLRSAPHGSLAEFAKRALGRLR